ncbi:unnamed protein product [Oncorhynchus mykiss]|uniref:Uncharacterized protein n=1 Tax=Oncorhynchus mykiss TaxID=8022 RepID=A0A060YUJ0_ONCMY|nr:unnamed protein product [Oncorhynchus mykiss]
MMCFMSGLSSLFDDVLCVFIGVMVCDHQLTCKNICPLFSLSPSFSRSPPLLSFALSCSVVLDSGLDSPLFLPYKALVSTVSSMVFSQGEAQRLLEILSDKAGIRQDTWHVATQKGDPVAVMKKQLEENQKQLATQQEDASAAKNRLRELSRELSAEKSKVASVETRLSSQLSSREQEMIASRLVCRPPTRTT